MTGLQTAALIALAIVLVAGFVALLPDLSRMLAP